MIEIVTVWAPRPAHPKFIDYMPLLDLQRRSVERVKHRHRVVCETQLAGYDCLEVGALPESLMHAILAAQLKYVEQWDDSHPVVMLDIDCMVMRPLDDIFEEPFDILLTYRANEASPIQNGAMYFNAGAKQAALRFLDSAYALCKEHWGGDQEAISKAVAPVPDQDMNEERFGACIAFRSTKKYNWSPKLLRRDYKKNRNIVHFKGESKQMAATFSEYLFANRLHEL